MTIKSFIGIATISLVLPFAAVADPEKKADKMAEKLGLDANQTAEVEEILTDYHEGKKALKEQKEEGLKGVLTDEQMEQLKAMHKEKDKKHHKDHYKKDH